jgi:hypothetical protein
VAHGDGPTIPGKRRTDAVFSLESDAFLCDAHALEGLAMKLAIVPTGAAEVSLDVICGRKRVDKRTKKIVQPTAPRLDDRAKGDGR